MNHDLKLYNRVRYLPQGAERALNKLARIKVEAESIGLPMDVLSDPEAFNAAWERAIQKAKLEAFCKGYVNTMGGGDGSE